MITSERQLAVNNLKLRELRESLVKIKSQKSVFAKASILETKALIQNLESEVEEYETLRDSGVEAIEINSLEDLMLLPIKYRIAKRMTQDAFARAVEIPVRMIARYEVEGYRNISGDNLHKILSKLPLKLSGKLKEA